MWGVLRVRDGQQPMGEQSEVQQANQICQPSLDQRVKGALLDALYDLRGWPLWAGRVPIGSAGRGQEKSWTRSRGRRTASAPAALLQTVGLDGDDLRPTVEVIHHGTPTTESRSWDER